MDKNSYALGMNIAHSMMQSGITRLQYEDFLSGLKDSLEGGKTALSLEEAGKVLQDYFAHLEAVKKEGEEFLAANAKEAGVKVLPSGLQYKVLKEGTGRSPKRTDKVRCHYEGTFINGMKFDSSYDRNEPAVFGVNQVIAGWTEALQLMKEGSEWMLYIPYNLAYGEAGAHGAIPPCATLIFKVELIAVL